MTEVLFLIKRAIPHQIWGFQHMLTEEGVLI